MLIGVLALQGAFIEHVHSLEKLNVPTILVKTPKDLENIDGIILPGGESTAIGKLLKDLNVFEPLKKRIENGMPVLGTCAGMILLAKHLSNDTRSHLSLMDITVKRNAYGRQLGSFTTMGDFKGIENKIEMTFIRAPYIESVGKDVEVLATVDDNIVAARENNMLAISFHPELTNDLSLHKYFVEMVKENI